MTVYHGEIVICTQNEILLKDSKIMHGFVLGQLAYDTVYNILYELTGRNPHVWSPISSPIVTKEGRCEFHGTVLRGEGLMGDIVHLGSTFVGNMMDNTGTCQQSQCGTAAVRNCGFGILPPITSDSQGVTRTNFLPYYKIKVVTQARTSGDYRVYSGWIKNSVGPILGETPITNMEGGIVVGFNAVDSTWSIWHSNGDGVTDVSKVPLDLVPIPSGASHYRIEMIFTTATNIVVNVYNASDVLLDSETITSNVLAFGRSMNWITAAQNPNQTNRSLTGYSAMMRALL